MSTPPPNSSADATINAFDHSWTARILASAPLIAPARQYLFPRQVPGEEDALQRGALLLDILPSSGGRFLATCALGFRDPSLPSGVWSCPAADDLLAVAGGYAYQINTLHPEATVLLEQRPVTAVVSAPEAALLLLAGFHDVLAFGAEGVRWRTGRLSWEGVNLHAVTGSELHGTGWDMFSDAEVPFTVDLRTGMHQGGGYARSKA